MAKLYDFNKAVELIEREKPLGLVTATMGMRGDWFWTARDVWNKEDGYLKFDTSMPFEEEEHKTIKDENIRIMGLEGSEWATPIIRFLYDDGKELELECHDGGVSNRQKPSWV